MQATTLQYLQTKYNKAGLTRKETAAELSVSIATFDRLLASGQGVPRYKRIGNRYFFPIREVAAFIDENLIKVY